MVLCLDMELGGGYGSQMQMSHWIGGAIAMVFVGVSGWGEAKAAGELKTYCNPLDLDYKYNFEEKWRNISYRSGADPVLINHEGGYVLFSTIADGFWRSKNLRDWRHVKPEGWPEKDMVAPAALSAKGKLWVLPSTYEQRPIYVVTDPFGPSPKLEVYNDQLPYLPGALGPWDPAFFYDEENGNV
jgi:hypothetical protein